MAPDFWDRVKSEIEAQNTTQEWVARMADIHPGTMKQQIHHKRLPDVVQGQKMAVALETTVEYLVTGAPPEGIRPAILALAREISRLSPADQDEVMALVRYKLGKYQAEAEYTPAEPPAPLEARDPEPEYGAEPEIVDLSRYRPKTKPVDSVIFTGWEMTLLPFYGNTAAGRPIDINIHTDQTFPFPVPLLRGNPKSYFIVRICGTGMTEAGIDDGDLVVIRQAEEPVNGKIMLVRHENSSTLKRLKIEENEDGRRVYLCWEDGSGEVKPADSSDYQVQGEFYRNLGA